MNSRPPNSHPLSMTYASWVRDEINAYWLRLGYDAGAWVEPMYSDRPDSGSYVVRSHMRNGVPPFRIKSRKTSKQRKAA